MVDLQALKPQPGPDLEGAPAASQSDDARSARLDDWYRLHWVDPDWFAEDADRSTRRLVEPRPPLEPSRCVVPMGLGPEEPEDATFGDLLKAVWEIPCVRTAVRELSDEVKALSAGKKAAIVSTSTVITLGMLAAIYSNARVRDRLIGENEGRRVPVPGVDGLAVYLLRRGGGLSVPVYGVKGLSVSGTFEMGEKQWQDVEYEVKVEFKVAQW